MCVAKRRLPFRDEFFSSRVRAAVNAQRNRRKGVMNVFQVFLSSLTIFHSVVGESYWPNLSFSVIGADSTLIS